MKFQLTVYTAFQKCVRSPNGKKIGQVWPVYGPIQVHALPARVMFLNITP